MVAMSCRKVGGLLQQFGGRGDTALVLTWSAPGAQDVGGGRLGTGTRLTVGGAISSAGAHASLNLPPHRRARLNGWN